MPILVYLKKGEKLEIPAGKSVKIRAVKAFKEVILLPQRNAYLSLYITFVGTKRKRADYLL